MSALLVLAVLPRAVLAQVPPASQQVITDPAWIWAMPTAEKSLEHPLRLEGRVSYFDPLWKLLWIEQDNVGTYVQLGTVPPMMKGGQRVRIEGTIVPAKGLEASRARVTVLEDFTPIEPLVANGRINDFTTLHSRIVSLEAYVDATQYIDADHVRLNLIVDNRPVIGWVRPTTPNTVPDWQGRFIRGVGLYSGKFDPTNTQTSIELWMSSESDAQILGTIADYHLFSKPVTNIHEIHQVPLGEFVRVRGRVQAHEVGTSMIIRDRSGEVLVRSIQQQRFPLGAKVEAVGRVTSVGAQWVLDAAFYRTPDDRDAGAPLGLSTTGQLTSIDQVRQLSAEQAATGRSVNVAGMVTWSLPEFDFFFLQDVSGGVRVDFDRSTIEPPQLNKFLQIEGVTRAVGLVPGIQLQRYVDLGAMSPPTERPITFEQAITGREDGQFVQMRGFLQRTVSDGDWRWIHVTTPSGEFIGHIQSPVNFVANPGSLIRVRGVCETSADEHGRIQGVTLRVPFLHDIVLEEEAPEDVFDLPIRTIKWVNQFNAGQELLRVRVSGTVLHAHPGRLLYLEEAGAGLLLLGPDIPEVKPGDSVEAVGILGRQGVRTILRESRVRKLGPGSPPAAIAVGDASGVAMGLDSRLVTLRATLLDRSARPGHARLTVQAGNTLFDATLDSSGTLPDLAPGAVLELTGIYKVVFDDTRQSRGFELQLRSPGDVRVIQRARLVTLQRALVVCAILAGVMLLAVAWITALRRRVHEQTQQIRLQLERQARLEAEVQRAARLESLGTLAGGIAHDFNNLLTVVLGNVTLAMVDERASAAAGEYLTEIERGAHRARELTQQLLTFAKGGNPLRSATALPPVVQAAVSAAVRDEKIRPEFDFPAEVWPALVDQAQLTLAINHLVANAAQAMGGTGVVTVSLRNEEHEADGKPGLSAGRYVKLTVADTGPGIPPEVLPRIFDPYFSTKKQGSGLGLATVYSIVRKHGGAIEAESEPGRGAAFHLWLPSAERDAPAPIPAPAGSGAPAITPPKAGTAAATKPRVLLMDDEESIRRVVEIVLTRMGVDPIVVADGAAALQEYERARESGRPIQLLILDLTIPTGMGGRQVMEILRSRGATVPAIVSSGYSHDPVLANHEQFGFQAVVPKPYDVRQLADMIKRFLDHDAPLPGKPAADPNRT